MSRFGASGADEPEMDDLERALEAYLQVAERGGDVEAFLAQQPLRDELAPLLELRAGLHADLPEPSDEAYLRGLAAVETEVRLRTRPRRRWRLPRLRFWVVFGGMGLGLAISAGVAAGPGPVPQLSSLLQPILMTQTPSVSTDNATVTPEAEPSATPRPPILQLPLADTGGPVAADTPRPLPSPVVPTPPPAQTNVFVLPPIATPVDTPSSEGFMPPDDTPMTLPSLTPTPRHTLATPTATPTTIKPTPVSPTSTPVPLTPTPTSTPTSTSVAGTPTPTPTQIRIIVTPKPSVTKTPSTGAGPGGNGGDTCPPDATPTETATPSATVVDATPLAPKKSLVAKTPTPCVEPTREPTSTPQPSVTPSNTPDATPKATTPTPDATTTPSATPAQPGGLVGLPGNDSVDCKVTPDDPSCVDAPSKSKPEATPTPEPTSTPTPTKSSIAQLNAALSPEQELALGRRRRERRFRAVS